MEIEKKEKRKQIHLAITPQIKEKLIRLCKYHRRDSFSAMISILIEDAPEPEEVKSNEQNR